MVVIDFTDRPFASNMMAGRLLRSLRTYCISPVYFVGF